MSLAILTLGGLMLSQQPAVAADVLALADAMQSIAGIRKLGRSSGKSR